MKRFFLSFLIGSVSFLGFSQNANTLFITSNETGLPLKNVNVCSNQNDTILVSDTLGIVNFEAFREGDTLYIKKFGYYPQIATTTQNEIILKRNTEIYSHDLKLLDLKFENGLSCIQLQINGEAYWFKQKYDLLYLGNGVELENTQAYVEIFQNHDIIKTVSVTTEYCLWKIRGENYANWIMAIYYNPTVKKKKSKTIPSTHWYSEKEMNKNLKILRLVNGCLD